MTKLIGIPRNLTADQSDVVAILEETLSQAKDGKIHAIAIVVCMDKGYAHVMAGSRASDLNLGCDSVKNEILGRVTVAGARALGRA